LSGVSRSRDICLSRVNRSHGNDSGISIPSSGHITSTSSRESATRTAIREYERPRPRRSIADRTRPRCHRPGSRSAGATSGTPSRPPDIRSADRAKHRSDLSALSDSGEIPAALSHLVEAATHQAASFVRWSSLPATPRDIRSISSDQISAVPEASR
jgi:hypothetical protein